MAARESYLRVVVHREGTEYILGLEFRPGDDFRALKAAAKMRMTNTMTGVSHTEWNDCALAIEKVVKKHWPDRAYFIEVGRDVDGWIQLFQPYGVPRTDVA